MDAISLLGLLLLAVGLAALRLVVGAGATYRVGPWPGLTPRGAGLLLACSVALAGTQLALGRAEVEVAARAPLTYVAGATFGATLVLTLAARLAQMPGTALAVCGAYLLPRSVVSLLAPGIALPAFLLVPSALLELALWARGPLSAIRAAWWRRSPVKPLPATRGDRCVEPGRAALGGALFGACLAVLEPTSAIVQGADASTWMQALALLVVVVGPVGAFAGWLAAASPGVSRHARAGG